ncbi:membrane-spanning 4-domains subfamily A member 4A [Osmerus eperlanus]|uniref:membrane-spanning 4-domains subfamily A member 4A n=1 Tax=Osmerus eperlanus TaxID=29151 RepID=UPI002E0DA8D3
MSTTITNANGVVVVSQFFPQNERGQITVPAPQVKREVPYSAPAEPSKVSEMTRIFLRGEPQSLGILQIFIGMLFVLVSLTAIISPTLHIQAPLFLGVAFVISGSLSVAARKGKSLGMMRATMALNIISAIVSLAGIGYLSLLLATASSDRICDISHYDEENNNTWRDRCMWMAWKLTSLMYGIWGLLLVLTVLEVCVSISGAVFSGKAIHRRGMHSIVVMVENRHTQFPVTSAASVSDDDVALLNGCGDDAVPAPPAYHP